MSRARCPKCGAPLRIDAPKGMIPVFACTAGCYPGGGWMCFGGVFAGSYQAKRMTAGD